MARDIVIGPVTHLDRASKKGWVSSTLTSSKPYSNLLDIMAQSAAAVCEALRDSQTDFLLSVREWTLLQRPELVAGEAVLAEVTVDGEGTALSEATITLQFRGEAVARSQVSFYQELQKLPSGM